MAEGKSGKGIYLAVSQSWLNSFETKQHVSLTFSTTLVWSIMYHCRNDMSSFRWLVRSLPPMSILFMHSGQ